MRIFLPIALLLMSCACQHDPRAASDVPVVRFASYNSSLYTETDGGLVARLEAGDAKAARIAAVIQHQRPDVLLLNEFDYDPEHRAAELFQRRYLEVPQHGQAAITYPYRYLAPVNTGVPSGMDLDRNGKITGGNDAFGFGLHPGQYGMLVLSRYPIDLKSIRTFQYFPWQNLPGAKSPVDPASGQDWYPPQVWDRMRLSSKSHWDVPVRTPLGLVHLLALHPTPPVFDGPEDRNGIRNRDEIRLWSEYISDRPAPWLCDDAGACGGLPGDALFVVLGDLNADPVDGDSTGRPMAALLEHPRVLRFDPPSSKGAEAASLRVGGGNLAHKGNAAHDTGDFGPRIGNLRLDYVIPSQGFLVHGSGVFWPTPDEAGADWIEATDHHMVWMDLAR